jgi:hypothetical protein
MTGFGMCGVYIHRTGFRQVGGRANGKVSSRLGVVRRGELYKACVGGITVLCVYLFIYFNRSFLIAEHHKTNKFF